MNRDLPGLHRTRRRTASQWKVIVDEFHKSGLTSKQFCVDKEIGYASFCQWRKRFSSKTALISNEKTFAASPSFIDLGTVSPSDCVASPWSIVLKLGNGVELCLSQGDVST